MAADNITVLFTDMVDSTATAASMSPENADEHRRRHFAILRKAIAEADGEEVKNLGDGVMIVFRSATAALSCAVEMQRGIEIDNRNRDRPVGLRAGLSGGEVTTEDGDYFGDPVIEAARLCGLCNGGQILAADIVRLTAGRRNEHPCVAIGEQMLKGLPYPVDTVEVTWAPVAGAGANGPELPPRLAIRPDAGFVSRVTELDMIHDAYKRVTAGEGTEVVLVAGEAGQGKTTMVAEAARRTFESGALVLFGRAEEDLSAPYKLFSEALTFMVKQATEEQLMTAVGDHGPELTRLIPALSARLPGLARSSASDADTERYLLFAAVLSTFVELSKDLPIVLVLDDLQWADQSGLQLLVHLVSSAQPMRLLILGTYRDDELAASHPLMEALAALWRQPRVSRIDLSGLDEQGVESLLAAGAGYALDDEATALAQLIHRDTDGNPFFVTELLRHLADAGQISVDPTRGWIAQTDLSQITMPNSLREVIGMRVGRLGPDAERLLWTAAVMGLDFDFSVLALATSTSEDVLLDTLDRAASAALVYEVTEVAGQFRFRHALIQRTLYDGIGATRRGVLHRQVAVAIEDFHAGRVERQAGELARHWSKTGRPADLATAVTYAKQAADEALTGLAPDIAHTYYAQAIALRAELPTADPVLDLDLQIGLGNAQRKTGDPAFRQTLLDSCRTALALDECERLLAAATTNSRGWASAIGTVDHERVEVLEATLEQLDADSTDRALVLAALCKELSYGTSLERRRALGDEAAAIAMASDDDAMAVRVLNDLALPLAVPQLLTDSLGRTEAALVRAERLGDPVLLFFASVWRAQTLGLAADLAGRDHFTARAGAMAERLGEPTLLWSDLNNRVVCALSRGDLEEADEITQAALALGTESGQPDADRYFSVEQMVLCLQRGILGELGELIEATMSEMPGLAATGGAALALSHLEGDRFQAAERMLDELGAQNYEMPIDQAWLTGLVDYADIAIERRLVRHAGPMREILLPWADLFACTGTTVQGCIAHYLGGLAMVLEDFDEAERSFMQADEFNRAVGGKFFIARTDLWWGQLSAARSDRPDLEAARTRLTASYRLAIEQGYAKVASRAAASLKQLG